MHYSFLKNPEGNIHEKRNQNCKIMAISPLDPLVFYPRFPQISENIFRYLDNKSLKNCREVTKSWQNCIGEYDFSLRSRL